MKLIAALSALLFLSVVTVNAAENARPPQAPPAPVFGKRAIRIGPNDWQGRSRGVKGKTALSVTPPQEVQPASIDITIDNRPLGSLKSAPYEMEFDSASVQDGEYTLMAVGRDAGGNQIWSATTKIRVMNTTVRIPDAGRVAPSAPASPINNEAKPSPVNHPANAVANAALVNVYNNLAYPFSIKYPVGWSVKDVTSSIKPKQDGAMWITLEPDSAGSPTMVINIRRAKIEPRTTPEKFAKANTYVNDWERKTMLGSPAFTTTQGSPDTKRVVHRMIILKDGYSWMMNCIDSTGRPAELSKKLFESIINSIKTTNTGAPGVSVKEVK